MARQGANSVVRLSRVTKSNPDLRYAMLRHYSESSGFVGRQLIYRILWNETTYGFIAGGSATRFLPNRQDFFGPHIGLRNIVNNTFFRLERVDGRYPCRNFARTVVSLWRFACREHWSTKYGDEVLGFESLVELPRTGELYLRDGWKEIGLTQGFSCRRISSDIIGPSTDSWSGTRVWSQDDARKKRVFVRWAE